MTERSHSCYVSWTKSKTGLPLPLYADGKPAASVYDPEKEALRFASLDVFKNAGFILIAGLGARLHINELAKCRPGCRIAVVEANKESADFIVKNEIKRPDHADVDICTASEVYDFLLQNYFPPVHGNFCLYPLRSWSQAQPGLFEFIKAETERALEHIASDVSTQARFGKIWHKNIIDNLSLYADMQSESRIDFFNSRFPVHKTAFIAAAGPSLESCFEPLKKKRNSYYIIATDTAFPALHAQGIRADAFVCIDPQLFSLRHLYTSIDDKTLFVCDSACSPLVPRKALKAGAGILFFNGNHPLCMLAHMYYAAENRDEPPLFPFFGSPEGTVTIAAVNFALKAGFMRIATGGADFCYTDGKAYTRGSYFDAAFGSLSTRLNTGEHLFCSLMYAKPLEEAALANKKRCFTTALLKAYREAFNRISDNHPGMIFPLEQEGFYSCKQSVETKTALYTHKRGFDIQGFVHFYAEELYKLQKGIKTDFSPAVYASILPYGARFAAQNGFFDLDKIIDEIFLKFPHSP